MIGFFTFAHLIYCFGQGLNQLYHGVQFDPIFMFLVLGHVCPELLLMYCKPTVFLVSLLTP